MDKRLTRSSSNRMFGGVCGGIAEYFGIDPTVVRVAYVLISFFTVFGGLLVYLVLCLVIPEN